MSATDSVDFASVRFVRDPFWFCCRACGGIDDEHRHDHDATTKIIIDGYGWAGWATCDDESHVAAVVAMALADPTGKTA